jgi:hypothetical protein
VEGELQKEVRKILENVELMILAIKATGGYKVRKQFKIPDIQIDRLCAESEPMIREMAIRLVIAEEMLREPAPSIHPRWEEYMRRREPYIQIASGCDRIGNVGLVS